MHQFDFEGSLVPRKIKKNLQLSDKIVKIYF